MAKASRWLGRQLFWWAVVLLVAWMGVATLRWFAVGETEREALALLRVETPAATGDNGYPWLVLADYDIPVDQVEAVVAEDAREFTRFLDAPPPRGNFWSMQVDGLPPAAPSVLNARFKLRPAPPADDPGCRLNQPDCLARVTAAPAAVRSVLEQQAVRVDAVQRALSAGHFRSPYPSANETPMPNYGNVRFALTSVALDAAEGRPGQALQRGCTLLADARRLNRHAQALLPQVVAQRLSEATALLLLDIRRANPGVPLPTECGAALAPVQTDDYLACRAMRDEFRSYSALARRLGQGVSSWHPVDLGTRLYFFDAGVMEAWLARGLGDACREDVQQAILEARATAATMTPPIGTGDASCYGAYMSCLLSSLAGPDVMQYARRMADSAATLRVLLAAHAVASGELAAADAARAASAPGYDATLENAPLALSIPLQQPRASEGARYRVAL